MSFEEKREGDTNFIYVRETDEGFFMYGYRNVRREKGQVVSLMKGSLRIRPDELVQVIAGENEDTVVGSIRVRKT